MSVTVYLRMDDKKTEKKVSVPNGKEVRFAHPGAPLEVIGDNSKIALLVVHPHDWFYVEIAD